MGPPPVDLTDRRVGIVGRLVSDDAAWSGIPGNLGRGLEACGLTPFTVSAEPPPRVEEAMRRYLRVRGRLDASWAQRREMTTLREQVVRARLVRASHRESVSWVQMGSEFGTPLPAGFVTVEDMTVMDALRLPGFVGGPLEPDVAKHWIKEQRDVYRRAAVCCVASRWQARSLIHDYDVPADKIRVIGFGQALVTEAVPREWSTPRFLFVGLGWDRKNGDRVLRAFTRLREDHPDATLDLVGDHPRADLAGVTGHGPLDHRIPEDRARARALLQQSTCFVLPSLYEPFGIVYVEAGAAGIASIATTVGGTLDAVGRDGGVFVDPLDETELLSAMRELSNPVRAAEAGAAAARHAALLSWPKVAARVAHALGLAAPDVEALADREELRRLV